MYLKRILILNIAIIAAYYGLAMLLLQLALPPSEAAPMWLSAGIAMGAVFVWGYALLPAAFIGGFLLGISHYGIVDQSVLYNAVLLGVQAALHAFLGRWLLVRTGSWPALLIHDAEILKFFLLSGLLAAIPPAALTVGMQLSMGMLTAGQFIQSSIIWGGGSALGVMLITPVMCSLFAQPESAWLPRRKNMALPLLGLTAVLLMVLFQTKQHDQQVNQQRFSSYAELAHGQFEKQLELEQLQLQSMRAYFLHSDEVTPAEFKSYVMALKHHEHDTYASMWIEITEKDNFYLRYVQANNILEKDFSAFGGRAICRTTFDAPRCRQAMQQTETLFIQPVFESLQSSFPEKFMMMQGFNKGEGQQNGIIASVFDYQTFFETLAASSPHQWVTFQVIDSLSNQRLYRSETHNPLPTEQLFTRNVVLSDTVQWQLNYAPSSYFHQAYQNQSLVNVLIAALAVITLLGTWLLSFSGRVAQIKQAVDEKTLALQQHMTMLRKSETKYRHLIENIKDEYVLYSHDIHGVLNYMSPSVETILGYSTHDMMTHYSEYMPPSEVNNKVDAYTAQTLSGKTMAYEVEMIDIHGKLRLMAVKEMPAQDELGNIIGVEGILRDITEQRKVQLALEKLSLAVEHSPNAIIITNRDRHIEYVNPKFTQMTGYTAHGTWPELTRSAIDQQGADAALWEMVLAGKEWRGEMLNRKQNGELYWAQEQVAPMLSKKTGEVTHVVINQVDITEARRLSEETSFQASHDLLTGLINRREFNLRLKRVIDTAKQDKSEHALCFMDLDQFKVINDTSGHIAGDELLRQVGRLLQANIRVRDTIARLGGDEFVILMEHCSIEQAFSACEDMISLFQDFRFHWEGYTFTIGASIGLTVIDKHTSDSTEAMRNVDNACYVAKDSGRNRVEVHTEDSARLQQRRGEIQWSSEISEALDEDRFLLYAQAIEPICSPELGTGYEILLRLRRRDGSLSPPGAFLPAAERYNSITRIDRWVVNKTISWLDAHVAQLEHIATVSINLSGLTIGDEAMLSFIRQRLQQAIFPLSKIKFEITETAAIANLSMATTFIESLKSMGVGFALDDFGSGLSSFAYLKKMQVDTLKIDGMFVKDMLTDPLDFEMVKSINEIGHVMGLKTIAEFVESKEILEKLAEIGVDYAQGYGIGYPAPIEIMLLSSTDIDA